MRPVKILALAAAFIFFGVVPPVHAQAPDAGSSPDAAVSADHAPPPAADAPPIAPVPVPAAAAPVPSPAAPGGAQEPVEPDLAPEDWAREYRSLRARWHTGLLAFAAGLVMLLSRLARTRLALRLLDRLPPDWRWMVPAALGVAVIVLPELAAGVDWWRAALDGIMAALTAIGAHSAIVRDLLGAPSPRAAERAGSGPSA